MERYRVRAPTKQYDDEGPDLLRGRDNAQRQMADLMGRALQGFFIQTNPPGDRDDWTDWNGPFKRGETLRRADEWMGKAGNGAKWRVGRRNKGNPNLKGELLVVNVREVNLPGTNAGAELVANLAREQFHGDSAGFTCREYNGIPGSGWSDHAWGDATDMWGPPNDKLTDWLVRMGKAGCLGDCAQLIGSRRGRVYSFYHPTYSANLGGPSSHLTHVHASYRQHYGANPGC